MLAIGVVSFATMAIVGSLPVGLQIVHDSRVQAAKANITGQLRGEFQQISFDADEDFSIGDLPGAARYYTADGVPTAENANDVYYQAAFKLGSAAVHDAGKGVTFQPEHARVIEVTLSHPCGAPHTQKSRFSLFSSRQTATAY